jgi:hypothetical protein
VKNRLRAFPKLENASLILIQKIRTCIEAKIKHVPLSLNQGQRSIFKFRECAQSIPRINLLSESHFQVENLKIFDFRFNTHIPIP